MYVCNWVLFFEILHNQARLAIKAWLATPQVLPAFNLMWPCSPHEVPHEFLIRVDPSAWSKPIAVTAWLRLVVPQLLKIPDL